MVFQGICALTMVMIYVYKKLEVKFCKKYTHMTQPVILVCHTSIIKTKGDDMLPIILGAVAVGTVSYGVNKLIKDEDFRDNIKDKIQDGAFKAYDTIESFENKYNLNSISLDKDEQDVAKWFTQPTAKATLTLADFYNYRKEVFDTTYKKYQDTISKIKNLELDLPEIILKDKKADDDNTAIALYRVLNKHNQKLSDGLIQISHYLDISDDYNTYSQDAKNHILESIDDAKNIAEILNLKVINKKGKVSKGAELVLANSLIY